MDNFWGFLLALATIAYILVKANGLLLRFPKAKARRI